MAEEISFPYVNAPLIPAEPVRAVNPKVTTFIGQMITGGTATPGEVIEDIDNNAEDGLFVAGSQLAEMIRNFRKTNTVSQVNAIALEDNAGGTASAGIVTFTGTTATENGTIFVYAGDKDSEHKATVGVAIDDTPDDIGAALEAAITALTRTPVTAANVSGVVTLTAKNKGSVGNGMNLIIEGSVAGITIALTAFTGGATDPVITGVEDLMDEYQTDVVMPHEYGIGDMVDWLDSRFNIANKILNGTLFTGIVDTKANLVVIGDLENSQSLVIQADKPVAKTFKTGNALASQIQNNVAKIAGTRALRINDGSSLAQIMTTRTPADNIGGVHTVTLPYANTKIVTLDPIPLGEGFKGDSFTGEVADLMAAGFTVMGNNLSRNAIILGEVLTMYKTNTQGLADKTYKFLNYVDTSTYAREYIFLAHKINYGQARLTDGQSLSSHPSVSESSVKADMMESYQDLSGEEFVLLRSGVIGDTGSTVAEKFNEALKVTINLIDGEINIEGILPIYTQVRVVNSPLAITFNF
jgi:phage tail sheath gpL-like